MTISSFSRLRAALLRVFGERLSCVSMNVQLLTFYCLRSFYAGLGTNEKDSTMSVYMVFPYMDHDLAGLLENDRVKLAPSQIKLYMKQLLEGTAYMHRVGPRCLFTPILCLFLLSSSSSPKNRILHRDMKAANLLISNEGRLRIADFGLARTFDPEIVHERGRYNKRGEERKYTNCVVTRWYRPPELLLGARQYGGEVDIWGVGCVFAIIRVCGFKSEE